MAENFRIAYIVPEFPKLSETAILNEVAALLEAGVDLHVIAFGRPREKTAHPAASAPHLRSRVYYLKRFGWGRARAWAAIRSMWCLFRRPNQSVRLRTHLKRHKVPTRYLSGLLGLADFLRMAETDLVHVQFGHVARFIAPLTDWLRLPLITSFRGWDASCFPAQMPRVYAPLFQSSRLVLVRCESMADDLASLGCPRGKLVVHHSGIDLDKFPMTKRPELEKGEVRLLIVGRFVDKKGIPAAVGTLRRILAKHPNAALRIIGSGPREDDIRQLIRNLQMEDHVELLGEKTQEEVAEEMARCHVFLLPSQTAWDGDKEGIPNSIMEAMASGMPVVSTDHAGISECVKDGKSGLLVPEKDADALENATLRLLAEPGRWEEMGRAGRRGIEEEFNRTKQAQRLIEIYKRVLETAAR